MNCFHGPCVSITQNIFFVKMRCAFLIACQPQMLRWYGMDIGKLIQAYLIH